MIRNDILQKFPDLFGAKKVNGHDVNVQETITTLTRELRPEIAAALTARRKFLNRPRRCAKNMAGPSGKRNLKIQSSGNVDVSPDRAGNDR